MEWTKENIEKAKQNISPELLGSIIDATNLKPEATRADIEKLCRDANEIGSFICVYPSRLRLAADYISDNDLENVRGIAVVMNFPSGCLEQRSAEKLARNGADEIDTVLNIGRLKDGDYVGVLQELKNTARIVRNNIKKQVVIKIIQENCLLTQKEKIIAAEMSAKIAKQFRIPVFAKTSTGFGKPPAGVPVGATPEDVRLMTEVIENYQRMLNISLEIGVKAAGGIKTLDDAVAMMIAGKCFDAKMRPRWGVDEMYKHFRIGASAGKKLVDELKAFHIKKDPTK